MKAMILAAGRGKRMAPLTDNCPKPLLKVGGKALISYHIERLKSCGITEVVINAAYLADQLIEALGNGHQFGISIHWSLEQTALETAGGIRHALPLLGNSPFLLVNGDVWTDFDFLKLMKSPLGNDLGRLMMIPHADHNPSGDFHLTPDGRIHLEGASKQVYGGVALLSPQLVKDVADGEACALISPLRKAIESNRLGGTLYEGEWVDVGTPARLNALDQRLSLG